MYNYCERSNDLFFGEPLNSISNIFFLIAATFLLKKQSKVYIFSILIYFIGFSSFFWHTIPNLTTGLLDITSIIFFILYYTYKLYKILFKNRLIAIVIAFTFCIVCFSLGKLGANTFLATSSFYIPILIHILLLNLFFYMRKEKNLSLNYLQFSFYIFLSSIAMRTLDFHLCEFIKIGTHFIWHFLNASLLYCMVKFYLDLSNRSSPKKPT